MPDNDMPVDEEHFDSIPWSSLIPQTRDHPWLIYVAAGAIVAVVVGMLAARSMGNADPVATVVTEITSPPMTAPAPPPSSGLISEADLRADLPLEPVGAEAAAMRAEWFVTDYFTRDGAGGREAELAGALGRPVPDTNAGATSYVEWARAWETVPEGDSRYRVSVAFRSITETESGFARGLVHAAAVRVQVGPNGGTRVVDLPEPIDMPASPTLPAPSHPEPVPEETATRALEQASSWGAGEPATVIEGINHDGRWRVVIEVSDDQGTVWPLVVYLDDQR
jgi:hypothetical protein